MKTEICPVQRINGEKTSNRTAIRELSKSEHAALTCIERGRALAYANKADSVGGDRGDTFVAASTGFAFRLVPYVAHEAGVKPGQVFVALHRLTSEAS